jgi:uncharacterized protein YoxC
VDAPDWLVDFLDGISLWDAIAIIAVIAAVVWFIAKKGWRGAIAFARAIIATATVIDNVRELPAFIERTDKTLHDHTKQLKGIYHETHKNDGSSIKDAVGRVEEGVAGLHGRMDAVERIVEPLEGSVEALKETAESLTREDESLWAALEDTHNPSEEDDQ